MKLTKIQVQKFRNILDSGEVDINDDVTCLVGKNESGKTGILQALNRVKPALRSVFDEGEDYPRWLQKRDKAAGAIADVHPITATFLLDDEDVLALEEEYGKGIVSGRVVRVIRNYAGGRLIGVQTEEAAAVADLVASITGPLVLPGLQAVRGLDALRQELAAAAIRAEADGADPDFAKQCEDAAEHVAARYGTEDVNTAVRGTVAEMIPQFFYFDEYSQLDGTVDIAPLLAAMRDDAKSDLTPAQRTALTLLEMASAGPDEMKSTDYEVRSGELEAVGADLTQQVLKYWSQNKNLRLKLDIDKITQNKSNGQHAVVDKLRLRVEDVRHYFTNSLDARSSGFRWFVSFIAAFSEFRDRATPVIILLDEPGLSLHAKAQADLLEYINIELKGNQVIYTTHSPFLVENGRLDRVRVVEDAGPEVGTKVSREVMSTDPDTLFPLQGALGYDIAQNLFVSPHNLIVEGVSDFTYLTVISDHLKSLGRTSLDPRWTVMPVGGGEKIPTFVALLGAHLDVTVLVDASAKGNQRLGHMAAAGQLDAQRIVTPAQITGEKEGDIEDLFDLDDYLGLYNKAFGAALKAKDLKGDDPVVRRIERSAGEFSHNVPADLFLRSRDEILPTLSPTTLDRFEGLIEKLNSTLAP